MARTAFVSRHSDARDLNLKYCNVLLGNAINKGHSQGAQSIKVVKMNNVDKHGFYIN